MVAAAPDIDLPEPTPAVKDAIDTHMPLDIDDGAFIVIEGIDGAGKSTILGALSHALDEDVFTMTTEPTAPGPFESEFGWAVRHAIKDDNTPPLAVFFLFLADHANHYFTTVKPALDRGDVVICDRYIDSRYAYQSYALRDAVANPADWLPALADALDAGPYPNIPVTDDLLDVPPEAVFFVSLARAFADDEVLHPAVRPGEHTVRLPAALDAVDSTLAAVADDPYEWIADVQEYDDTLAWIQSIQEYNDWSRLPDRTLLIDISVEESFARKDGDNFETFEKHDFLAAVRENYHRLAETESRFTVVDGEQTRADVVDAALGALDD